MIFRSLLTPLASVMACLLLVWGAPAGAAASSPSSSVSAHHASAARHARRRGAHKCRRRAKVRRARCHGRRRSTKGRGRPIPGSAQASPPSLSSSDAPCPGSDLRPRPDNIGEVRSATLCLVNRRRVAAGRRALRANGELQDAAEAHSHEMVRLDYFEHNSPLGPTPLARILASGYLPPGSGYSVGENIAYGTGGLASPRQIVASWMRSPGHRENIMNPRYRDTGVGIAAHAPASLSDGQPGATYTQDFGAHD